MSSYIGKSFKNTKGERYTVEGYACKRFTIRFDGQVLSQVISYSGIKSGHIANRWKLPAPLGSIVKTNNYGEALVIGFTHPNLKSKRKAYLKFINTGTIVKVNIGELSTGKIKDPLHRSRFGVGFIGQGVYKSKERGVDTRAYAKWAKMLDRCYNPYTLNLKPSYRDCHVCAEWHNFQTFAEWFYSQPNCDVDGITLDKDIKVQGNKIYSPNTCMLVSPSVNSSHTSNIASYDLMDRVTGDTYSGTNVAKLARELGVKPKGLYKLLSGSSKSYKGLVLRTPHNTP